VLTEWSIKPIMVARHQAVAANAGLGDGPSGLQEIAAAAGNASVVPAPVGEVLHTSLPKVQLSEPNSSSLVMVA
jgi:hypothetical protein